VTVCIAAICKGDDLVDTIVCTSDMQLSPLHPSEDLAAIKLRKIHPNWHAMIAGTLGQRRRVLGNISEDLKGQPEVTVLQMEDAFANAYKEYKRKLVDESILAPYGLRMWEFSEHRAELGDTIFERLWGEISRVKVGCDFLVCGFGPKRPHIFGVSNPTADNPSCITIHDDRSFGAIGSGANLAESGLYAYRQNAWNSVDITIYQTCAAKFSAETATDVGKATSLRVLKKGEVLDYDDSLPDKLRKIWERNRPKVPRAALAVIEASKGPAKDSVSKEEDEK
jgi:hypothetical protein